MKSFLFALFFISLTFSSVILWKSIDLNKKNDKNVIQIGGDFLLKDVNKKDFSLKKDLNKKYGLIFFGYSKCATICPQVLSNIFSGIEENPDIKKKFQPIFITLDPKTDSSEVLKEFSKNFSDQIIMLTSNDLNQENKDNWDENIKKIANNYKIYYSRNSNTNEIDHSSIVYIVNKNGDYLDHVSADNIEKFTKDLREFLKK